MRRLLVLAFVLVLVVDATAQTTPTERAAAAEILQEIEALQNRINPTEVYLEPMQQMIDNAARAAAMATGTEVEIDRYGEYRDGITVGSLEELFFAYAEKLDAPMRNAEPQRPAGYTASSPAFSINIWNASKQPTATRSAVWRRGSRVKRYETRVIG